MELERRSQLKIVDRGIADGPIPVAYPLLKKNHAKEWADEMWSEIARVHGLIDKVNAELSQLVSDDSMHALKVLEKNTEMRVLQAYYKGLRFAIDRQKEIAGRRLIGPIRLE
jgi:hypothetical protein